MRSPQQFFDLSNMLKILLFYSNLKSVSSRFSLFSESVGNFLSFLLIPFIFIFPFKFILINDFYQANDDDDGRRVEKREDEFEQKEIENVDDS